MALPRKLKYMNLFLDGTSYLGVVKAVTLPKLEQFYRVKGQKVIADGGYFITAYELARQ